MGVKGVFEKEDVEEVEEDEGVVIFFQFYNDCTFFFFFFFFRSKRFLIITLVELHQQHELATHYNLEYRNFPTLKYLECPCWDRRATRCIEYLLMELPQVFCSVRK